LILMDNANLIYGIPAFAGMTVLLKSKDFYLLKFLLIYFFIFTP
jgi:hypothetical protein